jgi:hypothetical protein
MVYNRLQTYRQILSSTPSCRLFKALIGVLKNRLVRFTFKYDIYFPVCPSSHDLLRVLDPSKMDYNCTFQGCLSKHPWQRDIKYQPRPLLVPKAKSFPRMIVK